MRRLLLTVLYVFLILVASTQQVYSVNTRSRQIKTPNNFENPDFAFPVTVEKNADSELRKAMKNLDSEPEGYVTVLKAVMQMVIARDLVSDDNVNSSVILIDSIADVFTKKQGFGLYASALANLLEASVLKEIYTSNEWDFNERTLPVENAGQNPMEWSREIFQDKVTSLVKKANEIMNDNHERYPIQTIKNIIVNYNQPYMSGCTVEDFIIFKSVDLLNTFSSRGNKSEVIPFFRDTDETGSNDKTPSEMIDSLLNRMIEIHETPDGSEMLQNAIMNKAEFLNGEEKKNFLDKWKTRLIETPYCGLILSMIFETNIHEIPLIETSDTVNPANEFSIKELYREIKSYCETYPQATGIEILKYHLYQITSESIKIYLQEFYVPGKDIEGSVHVTNRQSFNLLIFPIPSTEPDESEVKISKFKNSIPVQVVPMNVDEEVPFETDVKFSIKDLPVGRYAIIPSSTSTIAGIFPGFSDRTSALTFNVSGIYAFTLMDAGKNHGSSVYVVSSDNQRPIEDATVDFLKYSKNRYQLLKTKKTGNEGFVEGENNNLRIKAKKGKNFFFTHSSSIYKRKSSKILTGKILTDLSIYRPGDSVGFVALIYYKDETKLEIAKDERFKIYLRNANYQDADSMSLISDHTGRIEGKFRLPKNGLLGNYHIVVKNGVRTVADKNITVAEYKAPTFYITSEITNETCQIGDTIKITGEVRTYSGMPLGNAKVDYKVMFNGLRFMPVYQHSTYGGETVSDINGVYSIYLPTEKLKNTEFAKGRYSLDVSVTSSTGETQKAEPLAFSIGTDFNIEADIPEKICADKAKFEYRISVYDIAGHPVRKEVNYSIEDSNGDTVSEGCFESPVFKPDFSKLASGEYTISFRGENIRDAEDYNNKFILWRAKDKKPPVETELWIPETSITAKPGSKVDISVGSSFPDSWILAVISDINGEINRKWLRISEGIEKLNIEAPAADNRVWVTFAGLRDFSPTVSTVEIIPEEQLEKLTLETESFRKNVTAGSNEEWKFRFKMNNRSVGKVAAMAVMSNKALDALASFKWNLNPYDGISWINNCSIDSYFSRPRGTAFQLSKRENHPSVNYEMIDWDTYHLRFYSSYPYDRDYVVAGYASNSADGLIMERAESRVTSMKMAAPLAMKAEYAMELVDEEMVSEDSGTDSEEENSLASGASEEFNSPLRNVDCPIAFFFPSLESSEAGEINLNFEVPNFNTTWKFQLAGYDRSLKGTCISLETVASKPVMASMNAPRFLRTGDNGVISAAIFNNSADSLMIGARFEIFDPATDKMLKEDKFSYELLSPASSRTVMIEFTPTSQLNMIGIRIYGVSDSYSDGEQIIVPVLPSSTVVFDAEPFYISKGASVKTVNIPKINKDGVVTLQYNDNPIWECVTALPDIISPTSENTLSLIQAIYGNLVSSGLTKKYPEISEALKIFSNPENSGDSSLVSNLEKNSSLKVFALENTPWVCDAASETLRMTRLTSLLDPVSAGSINSYLINKLSDHQKSDGGWSWCEGMRSSKFVTERILHDLGALKRMGFLPDETLGIARKAVGFCDQQWLEIYEKNQKYFSAVSMLEYLNTRRVFSNISGEKFASLRKLCINAVRKDWKNMDLMKKASAASLLFAEGYKSEAYAILQSLREFATVDPEKGMWWDNLPSGYLGFDKLNVTSAILRSWHEISPLSPEIDKIRQWLLLQKQTGSWSRNRNIAGVITALLTTGSDWLKDKGSPEIWIGGKKKDIPRLSTFTGNFNIEIDSEDAGSELVIKKFSEAPSWGGIVSQYVAPINSVALKTTPQLSIKKELLLITNTEDGPKAIKTDKFRVGDEVKVTLTITAAQDMDYVAVKDERAAAMEPVTQTSGYTSTDGLWYYKEVRNTATNLFIEFLPKGTYIVNYTCRIDREGEYASGIASIQSEYAPTLTAHSAGQQIKVEE